MPLRGQPHIPHAPNAPKGFVVESSTTFGDKTTQIFRENTSGKQKSLQIGTSLHPEGGVIKTQVKQSNKRHSEIMSHLPADARVRRLFAVSQTHTTFNSKGNPLTKRAPSGNNSSMPHTREQVNTGGTGKSVRNIAKGFKNKTRTRQTQVANGSSRPANAIETATVRTANSTPNQAQRSSAVVANIATEVEGVLAATGTIKSVPSPNPKAMQTAVQSEVSHLTNTAVLTKANTSSVLPSREQTLASAQELANLAGRHNLEVAVPLTKSSSSKAKAKAKAKEEGNATTINANFAKQLEEAKVKKKAKPKPLPVESEDPYMTLANVRRGLPTGTDLSSNIPTVRAKEGLSPAPKLMNKKFIKSLGTLKQESSSDESPPRKVNTSTANSPRTRSSATATSTSATTGTAISSVQGINLSRTKPATPRLEVAGNASRVSSVEAAATTTRADAEATALRTTSEEPTALRTTSEEPIVPKVPSVEAAATTPRADAEATAPRTPSGELAASSKSGNLLPFKPENLSNLAHERGIGLGVINGIRTEVPNLSGFTATRAKKRVGKKITKKIIFNTEQKKILERKIRRAEEAARSGPSLLSKIWTLGLGMGHGDTRNTQHHIENLKSKLQTLDNSIAKSQTLLDKKRAAAQNKGTRQNLKETQKAIERTKHYRDLLSKYIESEATGEIEVPHTQKNTTEINATRKERAEKKTKKTNILAITNPANKRAVGLGENMQRLFNNTAAYGKKQPENTSPQVPKPVISNQPLVPKVNLAAKNTKRKAVANAMKGKDPYKLLGLNSSTINKEDFNSVVKETFDKLLRAKKPKNISNENHDKKLGELRQARDFLLNTTLRTGFNSRVVQTFNPATAHKSNAAALLAQQRQEPPIKPFTPAKPSNATMEGPKFANQIIVKNPNTSVSSAERNTSSALLFG